MALKIIVVQSSEQFHLIYDEFKNSAKLDLLDKNLESTNEKFLIGLDTEYISKDNNPESFSKCYNWVHRVKKIAVCKLQIATEKISLVIDLCKFEKQLPDNLVKIITSESWIKTGIGISNDLKYLSYNFDLGQCNGGIDIKQFAEMKGCLSPNLLNIFQNIAGTYDHHIKKSKKKDNFTFDWSLDMSMEQIEYASMDAYMSYKIGEYLIIGIVKYPQFDKFKFDIMDSNESMKNQKKILSNITLLITQKNYIGLLQEYAQKNKLKLPIYQDEVNNDPDKFKISCNFESLKVYGFGPNKVKAKTLSAEKMLYELDILPKIIDKNPLIH